MDSNEHFYEATYEIWRRGYNPDGLNPDQSDDDYYKGYEPEYTSNHEIKRQIKNQQPEH